MKNLILILTLAVIIILTGCNETLTSHDRKDPAMVHDVFFTLNDNSDQAIQTLIDACYKYLKDHDGVTFFAAGPRVKECNREVNIQDWDVALHAVFESKECHDKYQTIEDHLTFIAENKQNWKSVKVFDSFIAER